MAENHQLLYKIINDQDKKTPVEEGLMRKEMTAFKKCFHILNFEIKRLNRS